LVDRFLQAATMPAELRAELGRRAREGYLRRMCQRLGVDQLEQLLAEAAATRRRRG
jgi:colanic acid biosynthesis glycosyl transferase WcaI